MQTNSARVLDFTPGCCHPVREGTHRSQDFFLKVYEKICAACNLLHIPAVIKPIEIRDDISGIEIKLRTGKLFTVVSINERQFYFTRITGKFAGTGSVMTN